MVEMRRHGKGRMGGWGLQRVVWGKEKSNLDGGVEKYWEVGEVCPDRTISSHSPYKLARGR